eukprot:1340481-Rhodomonas_salina.1
MRKPELTGCLQEGNGALALVVLGILVEGAHHVGERRPVRRADTRTRSVSTRHAYQGAQASADGG